jgi:hypothetical protein
MQLSRRSHLVLLALAACSGGAPAGMGPPDAGAPDAAAPPDAGVCSPEPPTAATQQERARVGAYYFDGWTGPLSNFHFDGLREGPFVGRQPLTGWLSSDPCVVEQQLATARAFGLSFFVFDWYWGAPETTAGEDLNSALNFTRSFPDRHGMEYAILYVNPEGPYNAPASAWPEIIETWLGYFEDPAYLRVGGKPLVMIIDRSELRRTFGSPAGVREALDALRAAARSRGFPGVVVIGGFGRLPYQGGSGQFEPMAIDTVVDEGYDATSMYTEYTTIPGPERIERPYSDLASAARWVWKELATYSPLPVIPVVVSGWDSRPWNGTKVVWYSRTPQDVAILVNDAITWAGANPRMSLDPTEPPLVLIEAWNEMGEGGYILPTVEDGRSYGEAIAATLVAAPPRTRTVLRLSESGPTATPRRAQGQLLDAAGAPIAGAKVVVRAAPSEGSGLFASFTLTDDVPAGATTANVGFEVNRQLQPPNVMPGASDFALYQMSLKQADGAERVANPDFSAGLASWGVGLDAQLVASDRGPGQMVRVQIDASQEAGLASDHFPVTAGQPFTFTVLARVAPVSAGSGAFIINFVGGPAAERLYIPLASGAAEMGTATTDESGAFRVDLSALGQGRAEVTAEYAGDAAREPAWNRAAP